MPRLARRFEAGDVASPLPAHLARRVLADGLAHVEGGCWDPTRRSPLEGGEAGQVYRVELTGETNIVATIAGGALLGLALDEAGRLTTTTTRRTPSRRTHDPLYRIRKLLLSGAERLDERGHERTLLGLRLGDPNDENLGAWLAKESARDIYLTEDAAEAALLLDKAITGCLTDGVEESKSARRRAGPCRSLLLAGQGMQSQKSKVRVSEESRARRDGRHEDVPCRSARTRPVRRRRQR